MSLASAGAMSELIDTLWNVNLGTLILIVLMFCELIDTLWNVNIDIEKGCRGLEAELIDTLWNVNHKIAFNKLHTHDLN